MASYSGLQGAVLERSDGNVGVPQKETIGVLVEQITKQVIDIQGYTQDVLKVKLAPVTSMRPPRPEDDLKSPIEQTTAMNLLGYLREINNGLDRHRQELADIVSELDL